MRIFHPPDYLKKIIKNELLTNNNVDAEKVWTYLVAKIYENNHSGLINKLCGNSEMVPVNSTIWFEAHLSKTRIEKTSSGEVIPDLSVGYLEKVPTKKAKIISNGNWICTVEAKWGSDDRLKNSRRSQIVKLIESSLLLNSNKSKLPDRVYITLLTPEYMTVSHNHFKMKYHETFKTYQYDYKNKLDDLHCSFPLKKKFKHDLLVKRIKNNLKLNWVTYEELLGVDNLMHTKIPGRFETTRKSWESVFKELNLENLYYILTH